MPFDAAASTLADIAGMVPFQGLHYPRITGALSIAAALIEWIASIGD